LLPVLTAFASAMMAMIGKQKIKKTKNTKSVFIESPVEIAEKPSLMRAGRAC
jgi:hypothetical protein